MSLVWFEKSSWTITFLTRICFLLNLYLITKTYYKAFHAMVKEQWPKKMFLVENDEKDKEGKGGKGN